MQAAGAGAGGAEGRDGPDDQVAPGSPGGAGAAAAVVRGAQPVERSPHAPGPGGDAASRRAGNLLHILGTRNPNRYGCCLNRIPNSALSVPFPSALEAEIALGSLAPDAEPHRVAVQKELTVIGSTLAVRWRAEDSRLLRISIINFLDQLSLVVRTMQRFGPAVSR
ncbi:EKC/KEOPS complex subunit Lage3 [Galemys pyrenaicus]|uniref:L antigen family member 3 n=1 Tax=Galemys pyrenaicus TaxID=202257 RepID=A0A8J6DN43_GALPY|nr:EKC/KEOPS complex subunit Lage3 [Galemys pyrenaicus]